MLKAVKSFNSESRACVKGESGMSEGFGVEVGLRQGSVMSPWLFNMYMDGVVREVDRRLGERGGEMIGQRGNVWWVIQLLYADECQLGIQGKT